jgi:hypothetical protein
LFVHLARQAPLALILRRGPSRWVQLILWHTRGDTFTYGQWFHGRIFERRCDLSPDGSMFIYFASKMTGRTIGDPEYTYAWTAISRPPYFTALALWPKGDRYAGGGLFLDDRTVWLNHRPEQATPQKDHRPQGLKIIANPGAAGEDYPVYARRLRRDGWTLVQEGIRQPPSSKSRGLFKLTQPEIWQIAAPDTAYSLRMAHAAVDFRREGSPYVLAFTVVHTPTGQEVLRLVEDTTWAEWDQRGRLAYTTGGNLFVMTGALPDVTPERIAEFNGEQPHGVSTPEWAQQW